MKHLLKKLKEIGTTSHHTGSGRLCALSTETNIEVVGKLVLSLLITLSAS